MTKEQMKWAKEHDWYVRAEDHPYHGWVVWGLAPSSSADGVAGCDSICTSDINELREWAGY